MTEVFRTIADLRAAGARWRGQGENIALIPTMGALHAGHLSLVAAARANGARRTIISIFVNPTQFGAGEDFGAYPRTFAADMEKLATIGADACFAPPPDEIYPPNFCTKVIPGGPALANLEDRFRPDHFAGVAQVVAKLLNQAQADGAFFGEKDYQQLAVIRQMAGDLDIPTQIHGVPTMREPDGLAMSSRNVYLSPDQRQRAALLSHTLVETAQGARAGKNIAALCAAAAQNIEAGGFALDYFEARHAVTLAPVATLTDGPVRLLVAARLGKTRLIDNMAV